MSRSLSFRPWSDSLLLDEGAGTEYEHSAVRFSIHSWITAVSTRASHKRAPSTFGNGECRHPTRPPPPKRHTMQEKQYLEVTPCQRQFETWILPKNMEVVIFGFANCLTLQGDRN
jgi:hypothetical protein